MLQVLTKAESDRMNDDIVQWVTETLEGDNSTYLYNILLQVRQLMEHMARSKITWEEQQKLFMDGLHFAETQRKNNAMVRKIKKLDKKK